jgi:hypothetical protein
LTSFSFDALEQAQAQPLAGERGGASTAPPVPHFVDETDAAGIQSRFDGDWEYTVGGGVAAFDCDGSGLPSLFIAGGANRSKFYRNRSARGGALKFVVERAGLELTSTLGAYPIDIDGDGVLDLVVLRVGETLLMRGLGDCRFERGNERWAFQGAADTRLRHLRRSRAAGLSLGQLHGQSARAARAREQGLVRAAAHAQARPLRARHVVLGLEPQRHAGAAYHQ